MPPKLELSSLYSVLTFSLASPGCSRGVLPRGPFRRERSRGGERSEGEILLRAPHGRLHELRAILQAIIRPPARFTLRGSPQVSDPIFLSVLVGCSVSRFALLCYFVS